MNPPSTNPPPQNPPSKPPAPKKIRPKRSSKKKSPPKPPPHPPAANTAMTAPPVTPATPSAAAAENMVSVLSAIRDIQSGALHSKGLSVEDRQRCVEHLTAEGYSTAEIAEILKIGERMVLRDRKAIRAANALHVDEHFAAETAGGLLKQAELAISRLRRIGRDRETPASVKVDAERAIWDIARDLVLTLQRLGHLPTPAQEIRGQLIHRLDQAPSLEDLTGELSRLHHIMSTVPESACVPADIIDRVAETQDAVSRLSLAKRVQSLTVAVNTEVQSHEQ